MINPHQQEEDDAWFSRGDRFDGFDRGDLDRPDADDDLPPAVGHEFDDDGVCIHCGFDGAEFSHHKSQGYEYERPACTRE